MAKLCVKCGSLCAYFLLLLTTAAVCSVNDYYFYKTDFPDNTKNLHISRDLLGYETGHRIHKRDAEIESNQSNTRTELKDTQGLKLNDTKVQPVTEQSNSGVAVGNKSLTDNKVSSAKTKLGKTPKTIQATANLTKTVENLQKNLGENGTGIRKNITTIKPILLSTPTTSPAFQNITLASNDDLTIADTVPPDEDSEVFNKTLAEHHITNTTEDSHGYYNSSIMTDEKLAQAYWVDLSNNPKVKINELLSRSHRRAATIQLNFEFPFYGHLIKNVTIATGGFLYTGDYVHSWLAATQYIAPLMANFDTSISNDSYIRYYDNGSAFTVEWERVELQDKLTEGEYTFQVTLFESGDIVFVYKNIPLFIKNITDDNHPVKVGLSDAYIIDRTIFLVRRKTIYEYHRINFVKEDIRNGTVIYLTALPTCLQNKDCISCATSHIPSFQCYWCPTIKKCSSGMDRNRQDWITNRCQSKPLNVSACSHISGPDIFDESNITYVHDANEFQHQLEGYPKRSNSQFNNVNALGLNQPVKMGVSSIVAILFLIAMVLGLGIWVLYAYRNPHTTSGQILIRYRPSQWRWRRGEARYTAATIHM